MTEKIKLFYDSITAECIGTVCLDELIRLVREEGYNDGYNKGLSDNTKIKPLVFDGETAHTSVATYDVYRDDEDYMIHVDIDNCHEGVFDYREDAIRYCREHYESLIKQCLISEE